MTRHDLERLVGKLDYTDDDVYLSVCPIHGGLIPPMYFDLFRRVFWCDYCSISGPLATLEERIRKHKHNRTER